MFSSILQYSYENNNLCCSRKRDAIYVNCIKNCEKKDKTENEYRNTKQIELR